MTKKETPVEEAMKLYEMGLNDSEVISRLTEEGFSPVQISDAINQAKIKQEVELSDLNSLTAPYEPHEKSPPIQPKHLAKSSLQQAMSPHVPTMKAHLPPVHKVASKSHALDIPVPRPSAVSPTPSSSRAQLKVQRQPVAQPRREAPQAEEEPSSYPYSYPTYQEEQPQQSPKMETEAIEEIAEQVVEEKWQEVKTKINDVIEWKGYADKRITAIDERIKRVESSIDRLQAALLSKVNEYGTGIKELSSEMSSLEGALGKILPPLVDNVKELRGITDDFKSTSTQHIAQKKKKSSKK